MTAENPAKKKVPEGIEAINILRSVARHSDRELAIVGVALLEHSLRPLLERCFRDVNAEVRKTLWGANGVLSTFSARINMAYALNIIDEDIRSDLDILRLIRNDFAHSAQDVGFTDPSISKLCYKLNVKKAYFERFAADKPLEEQITAREAFYLTNEALWFFIQGPMTGEALRKATRPEG